MAQEAAGEGWWAGTVIQAASWAAHPSSHTREINTFLIQFSPMRHAQAQDDFSAVNSVSQPTPTEESEGRLCLRLRASFYSF